MALKISPRSNLDSMIKGVEVSFELDVTEELDGDTVSAHTFTIYDSSDEVVTDAFSGGSLLDSGIITFGVKAAETGDYTLQFIVTCNEFLPDGTTPKEFYVIMTVKITS